MQALHHNLEERRRQELESIPYQRAVERTFFKRQGSFEKALDLPGMALILVKIAVAETRVHLMDEVVGVEAMPVIGDEAHRRLAGSGQIENR